MASRKESKKDIEFVVAEMISDCLNYLHLYKGKNEEEVLGMIEELLALRDELIARINHIDGKDNPALVKAHFKKIYTDLSEKTLQGADKLSALVKLN